MKENKMYKLALFTVVMLSVSLFFTSSLARADVFTKPSLILDLGTTSISAGAEADVVEISPEAANMGVFTVPLSKVLVITTVIIFPQSPGAGTLFVTLIQNSASRHYWVVPNSGPTQLQFPTGVVIAPGYQLKVQNGVSSAGAIRVKIMGYIAKDK